MVIMTLLTSSRFVFVAELGDYDHQRLAIGYVSEFRFVPNQTEELEDTIAALHRRLGFVIYCYFVALKDYI